MKRSFTLFFALLIALFCALPVFAWEASPRDIAADILNAQMKKAGTFDLQGYLDLLAETPEDGREWTVFALSRTESELDFSRYAEALNAYASEKGMRNAVSAQKYAFILFSLGFSSDFTDKVLAEAAGTMGTMSDVFGLHMAENSANRDEKEIDRLILSLLARRCPDGGFSVTGDTADVDVTAMALQALAPYYGKRQDVTETVDGALTLLCEKQTGTGAFLSYGVENPESASQVIIALCSLGIDPLQDERFTKNGNTLMDEVMRFYSLSEHTVSHTLGETASENATVQALLAMIALDRLYAGKTALYDLEHPSFVRLEAEKTEGKAETVSYKLPLVLIVLGISAVVSCVLFLCKKRSFKHYLPVLLLAGLAILLILTLHFESTDSYYGDTGKKENATGTVTLSIRCDTLVGKFEEDHIPADGIVLDATAFDITEGDTVYSVLEEAARKHRIQMEVSGAGELIYVEGIAYLYEMGFGPLSGWTFLVNGESASVGCGQHSVKDGDIIEWVYTLELGRVSP